MPFAVREFALALYGNISTWLLTIGVQVFTIICLFIYIFSKLESWFSVFFSSVFIPFIRKHFLLIISEYFAFECWVPCAKISFPNAVCIISSPEGIAEGMKGMQNTHCTKNVYQRGQEFYSLGSQRCSWGHWLPDGVVFWGKYASKWAFYIRIFVRHVHLRKWSRY